MRFSINSVELFAVKSIIAFGVILAVVTLIDMVIRIIKKKNDSKKTKKNPDDSEKNSNATPTKEESVDDNTSPTQYI